MTPPLLQPLVSAGANANAGSNGTFNLEIPPGPAGMYRIAQRDDYRAGGRLRFSWQPPLSLSLQARASAPEIPGTWGFGFWNAPFSMSLGFGGNRMLPALPNAAWFFFASPPNHLSFRDDQPGRGFLAQVFRSINVPSVLFTPGVILMPLLSLRPFARRVRQLAARLISGSAAGISADPTTWHEYAIRWDETEVEFKVDGRTVHRSPFSPAGPLGLVLWIDNQYAAFTPEGRIGYGTLVYDRPAGLQIRSLELDR